MIHKETEGNPFFIEEVAKALVEQGQIYLENGEWERKAIDELVIPQSIKEAIGRRLDGLSREGLEILQSAAVLGKDFEFVELSAIIDLDEDRLLDVLDEAERAQLIQIRSGERFVFTHDKIREVLYEELNPIRQRRLHREIINALEKMMGRNYHYRGQYDQSLEYLERARELAEPGGDPVILSNIYGYLSGSYQHLGRYEDSNQWARKNIELGERRDFPAAVALGHEFLSENAWVQGNWERSIYHAEVNRQLGEKMGAQSRIAWSGFAKLGAYRGQGDLRAAKSEGWEKLRIAQEIGERRLVVWIKSNLSMNETDMKEDQSALELAESAVSLAQEQGEPSLISTSRSALAY